MPVPIQYRRSGEGAIASYDGYDIAAGTGIVNFYAGKTSGACILSNVKYYSDTIMTAVSGLHNAWTKEINLNFDAPINRPLVIKGKTIINVPFYLGIASTSQVSGQCIVRVKKWDGTTETEIISASSRVLSTTAASYWEIFALDVDIPLTSFKKGETLRLTVEGWAWQAAAVTAYIRIAHDPMDRYKTFGAVGEIWDATNTPAVPSTLIFQVPTRIDL